MKKKFAGILAGVIAGNTAFCATQAIATQETNMQPVDQYWIIDLEEIEWGIPEASSASETSESEEETDVSEPAQAAYLNETGLFESENQQDMIYARDYAVKGVRMDEAIISYLLDGCEAYADYGAIDICEVTYLQPEDENGLFKLFLQKEDGASVIHYSLDAEGLLQKTIENTDFVSADGSDSKTNHWLIVHLTPEVAETPDASQTSAEGDQTASESLDGKVNSEPETAPTKASQDVAKASESVKAPSSAYAVSTSTAGTKAPETKPASKPTTTPTTSAPTTAAPTKAPETTAPTKAPETTAPTTTAHTHNWVAVTATVHHDATYKDVWVQDSAAWDETIVTKEAWDETIVTKEAWDEPVYVWSAVCNVCGYHFPLDATSDDIGYHEMVDPGCGGGWYDVQIQTGTVHHEAETTVVHHDAEYTTVHHDATGHNEKVVDQAAWDETVTTGYKCSGCGVTK